MKNTKAYLITCLTNMHVGAGGTNYDVIDNQVQRDVTTNLPTINASSLKGALREFFKNKWGEGKDEDKEDKLNHIFGKKDGGGIGYYNFFSADLISLPVRAKNKAFYNATSPFLLDRINDLAKNLLVGRVKNNGETTKKIDVIKTINNKETAENNAPKTANGNDLLEDWKATSGLTLADKNIGNNIALFSESDFKRLAKKLPVIARNQLDNGESKNLFYEEVVPRETRFVFFVVQDDKFNKDFEDELKNDVIQIGANGSIGYGFCKITNITPKKD